MLPRGGSLNGAPPATGIHPSRPTPSRHDISVQPVLPSTPPVAPSMDSRRRNIPAGSGTARRRDSDFDSDEEADRLDEEEAFRYLEHFSAPRGDPEEYRVRAQQIIRGQLPTRRVASKRAISQLQSVDRNTLPESEQSKSSPGSIMPIV